MKRGSSVRLIGLPSGEVAGASSTSVIVVSPHAPAGAAAPSRIAHGRGRADRGHDVLVAGTAADVALDRVADLVVGRVAVAGEQVGRGHDHARRAEAALQAVLLPEGGLERVELVRAGGHALDGGDGGAVGLDGEHRARLHGAAVDVDGAGAALAGVAADVGAGQVEVLADGLDEQPSRLDVELPLRSVDREGDVFSPRADLLRRLTAAAPTARPSRGWRIAASAGALGTSADGLRGGSAGGGPTMVAPRGAGIKSARRVTAPRPPSGRRRRPRGRRPGRRPSCRSRPR